MTSASLATETDAKCRILPGIPFKEEMESSFLKKKDRLEHYGFKAAKTQFPREPLPDKSSAIRIEKEQALFSMSGPRSQMESFIHSQEALFVATHREEIDGYVKKIIEDKAYLVFETAGGSLERVVKLLRLKAIHADRQGALIRLVVEEKGASMNVKFENLEEKGIATWRDKIKDEDLEKYDLLRKFAIPPKPSKLQ